MNTNSSDKKIKLLISFRSNLPNSLGNAGQV